jgi:hypothetical protein
MEHHLEFLNPNEQQTEFDSTCIYECMDYYKETGDISFLENAINWNAKKIVKAKEEITLLRDTIASSKKDYHYYINKCNDILKTLKG